MLLVELGDPLLDGQDEHAELPTQPNKAQKVTATSSASKKNLLMQQYPNGKACFPG
jgi:hypothetical protein